MKFHVFSASILALIFYHLFNGKWLPKGSTSRVIPCSLLLSFGDLFRTSIFMLIYVDFGCLLAPFCLPLAPFWLPLAPFLLPLAPFWHPPGSFSHFWQHCGFVFAFFMFICSKFAPTFHFGRIFEQNIFFGRPVRKTSGTAARAPNQKELSKGIPSSQGPERNLAEGNFD